MKIYFVQHNSVYVMRVTNKCEHNHRIIEACISIHMCARPQS